MSRTPSRRLLQGLAAIACFVLAACGPKDLGPWQEEVKLADGRVIVVERFEDSEIRGPIGDAKDSYINTTTIKFIAPNVHRRRFNGTFEKCRINSKENRENNGTTQKSEFEKRRKMIQL